MRTGTRARGGGKNGLGLCTGARGHNRRYCVFGRWFHHCGHDPLRVARQRASVDEKLATLKGAIEADLANRRAAVDQSLAQFKGELDKGLAEQKAHLEQRTLFRAE